jgi:membrane protein DedA with SNARE-associated domain
MDQTFLDRFQELMSGFGLSAIIWLLIVNFITGSVAAAVSKTFTAKDVANIMGKKLVPIVVGYMAVVAVAVVDDSLQWLIPTVATAASVSLTAAVIGAALLFIFGRRARKPAQPKMDVDVVLKVEA